ncbi:unnamed protein product [Camellia sinensis]
MAEQSFLDLKPKFRKIRMTKEKLLLCNKWRIRFLMVGMPKMKLVKMVKKLRGTRESKLVERTVGFETTYEKTQMGCIAQVGLRFHFRSQPPIMGKSFTRCQTFYSEQDLMRYINYAKRAKVSIYAPNYTPTVGASRRRKKQRPNPPKVRKEAEKEAAGKQCSKGLMHASNESDEESNNPEVVSLPSELPKKVRHDKAPNSTSVFDDEVAEFHLSNYYQ